MGNLDHIEPPLPGEDIATYMKRLNAHPSQPNRTKSTPEQMAQNDRTHERLGGGMIITTGKTKSPPESPSPEAKGMALGTSCINSSFDS